MPTVETIEQALFHLAPKEFALDWDNVGHLEGDPAQEVQRVLVALDVTEDVVSEAERLGCQLIVSHHPLMNVRWHEKEMQTLRPDRYLAICCVDWSRRTFPSFPCIQIWTSPPAASMTLWLRRCGLRTLGPCREMKAGCAGWGGCKML